MIGRKAEGEGMRAAAAAGVESDAGWRVEGVWACERYRREVGLGRVWAGRTARGHSRWPCRRMAQIVQSAQR